MNLHWKLSSPNCEGLFTKFNLLYICSCLEKNGNYDIHPYHVILTIIMFIIILLLMVG